MAVSQLFTPKGVKMKKPCFFTVTNHSTNYSNELVKKINMSDYHELIEPELLNINKQFDIIFIDGWHKIDYTLMDIFYSYQLIKLYGYIIIDNADNLVVCIIITIYQKSGIDKRPHDLYIN